MASGKLSVRKQAVKTREDTLNSDEFATWWKYRRQMQPTPSEPYRAYMIDRSLHATHHPKDEWKGYVNRTDLPPVDNARGYRPPSRKQRRQRRAGHVPASTKRKDYSKDVFYQDIVKYKDAFENKYNLPASKLVIEKRAGSAYQHPGRIIKSPGEVLIPARMYEAVKKSGKKSDFQQFFASMGHELGHHSQLAYGGGITAVPSGEKGLGAIWERSSKSRTAKTNLQKAEKFAHEVNKDFVKTKPKHFKKGKYGRMARLREITAYGSYRKFTPKAVKGPNAPFYWDLGTNLVKPRSAPGKNIAKVHPKATISGISERIVGKKSRKSKKLKLF